MTYFYCRGTKVLDIAGGFYVCIQLGRQAEWQADSRGKQEGRQASRQASRQAAGREDGMQPCVCLCWT